MFFRGFFDKTKYIEQCLHELEAVIAEQNSKGSTLSSKSKNPSKAQRSRRQLTPIELLSHVRSHFPDSVRKMQIDYISLVRTCKALLEEMKAKLQEEYRDQGEAHMHQWLMHDNEVSPLTGQTESANATLCIIPFVVFGEEAEIHALSEELFRKEMKKLGPPPAGPKLGIVGDILRKFVNQRSLKVEKKKEVSKGVHNGENRKAEGRVDAKNAATNNKSESSWEARAAKAFS